MQSRMFEIEATSGFARLGKLTLAHGLIETPVFMPVGTIGAVKTLSPDDLCQIKSQIILGNTYHLFLRPGVDILKHFGGLHRFMNWQRPILTDSGGFQIFSLKKRLKISDEGVLFQSHLNGDKILLTPERSAEIQQIIGSDIAMVLDECLALPSERNKMQEAVERSFSWAQRFFTFHQQNPHTYQKVFAICQGGIDLELRKVSLEKTLALNIDGIAIGGLSVGEPHEEMVKVLQHLAPSLPKHLPHYLMGVGTPLDLLEAVAQGIDMFDCVLPTRNARNAMLFTSQGPLHIRNSQYKKDSDPVDPHCLCYTCQTFSKGYLHHLFRIGEILGLRLATLHNVYYYHDFMSQIRTALRNKSFSIFYQTEKEKLKRWYLKPKGEAPC